MHLIAAEHGHKKCLALLLKKDADQYVTDNVSFQNFNNLKQSN